MPRTRPSLTLLSVLSVACILGCVPADTAAQSAPAIASGELVWVDTDSSVHIGRVSAVSGRALELEEAGLRVRVPLEHVQRLQVQRRGPHRSVLSFVIGAGLGGGLGLVCAGGARLGELGDSCGGRQAEFAAWGAIIGGVLGLVVGPRASGRGWVEVPLSQRRVTFVPLGADGAALAFSVVF